MKVTINQTIKEIGPATFDATVSVFDETGSEINRTITRYERANEIYAAYKSLLKALNWLRRHGQVEIELFTNQKSLVNELNGSLNPNTTLNRILNESLTKQNASITKAEYRE
jgi:ribonuclease HI